MASTVSSLCHAFSLQHVHNSSSSCKAHATKPAPAYPTVSLSGRRRLLFLLTASTALTTREQISRAQDIPLFGLRKNLKKAEEKAEEIFKEGFEAADKGLEAAERGIETAEEGIDTAEREIVSAEKGIESALSFGGLAQAGVVAGAEFVGVLIATAVVNGILGPEAQNS
ncbi:Synechocystis YCF37-like protein [Quillaja saponaria]|uniref:Synechocystis YCF37-like protein n=1 Tax=Quillaja saponaria TaxID=32244 RepID=A0AAD7P6T3_QUISA|nr:Synechocystis YCF37-like protein [Quillaja saponaria]